MKTFAVLATLCLFYVLGADGSVSKCYSCTGKCADPLKEENCPAETAGIGYLCWTSVTESGDTKVEIKKCMPDVDATKATCDALDDQDNSRCRVCDTDLCNSAEMFSVSVVLLSVAFGFLTRIL